MRTGARGGRAGRGWRDWRGPPGGRWWVAPWGNCTRHTDCEGTVRIVPTTYSRRPERLNYRRPRWRRVVVVLVVLAVLAGGACYAGYTIYQRVATALIVPGCQAGSAPTRCRWIPTRPRSRRRSPASRPGWGCLPGRSRSRTRPPCRSPSSRIRPYGDLDSVGVFQQRPSQGWGSTAQLEDPEYASTAFLSALVKVPGYQNLPIDEAAQDVQHSADGSAYSQWDAHGRTARHRLHRRSARRDLLVHARGEHQGRPGVGRDRAGARFWPDGRG